VKAAIIDTFSGIASLGLCNDGVVNALARGKATVINTSLKLPVSDCMTARECRSRGHRYVRQSTLLHLYCLFGTMKAVAHTESESYHNRCVLNLPLWACSIVVEVTAQDEHLSTAFNTFHTSYRIRQVRSESTKGKRECRNRHLSLSYCIRNARSEKVEGQEGKQPHHNQHLHPYYHIRKVRNEPREASDPPQSTLSALLPLQEGA
jgi:hypothetical protein